MGAEIGDAGLDFVLVFAALWHAREREWALAGSGLPIVSASIASMSGMAGEVCADRRRIGGTVGETGAGFSTSGFLPVTDCTNAMVWAIRRSRSRIHFMTPPNA